MDNINVPIVPPLPRDLVKIGSRTNVCVGAPTNDMWDRLFDEAYRADVSISTENGGIIYAHSNILGMASPVMKNMLKDFRRKGNRKFISIHGVPPDAVRVFIRFLYSSRYEEREMKAFGLHLLVLSHSYMITHLKRLCECKLEHGLISTENVVDIFQLSLLCDAPRLGFICHRMIVRNFKVVNESDGWKAMKQSHSVLEKEIIASMAYEDAAKKARRRKVEELKIYLQLYEAMEALVHICRDGCRTIGPHDKILKKGEPCNFNACKGLEMLVRHLASCKMRVPGSCVNCKRMGQLLELHSRLCADSKSCKVPLCRNFKDRINKQSKKDEVKWKLLVRNILRSKSISGIPFFSSST